MKQVNVRDQLFTLCIIKIGVVLPFLPKFCQKCALALNYLLYTYIYIITSNEIHLDVKQLVRCHPLVKL